MEIELIQITDLKAIESAMRIPYKKIKVDEIGTKIANSKHFSILEHSSVTFKIFGISRALTHQLVRQRIGVTFTQESQRYVELDTESDWYVTPPSLTKDQEYKYHDFMSWVAQYYEFLLENDIRKEDARFVLPNATKTTIQVTWNMNSLRYFLNQRLSPHAQWEIRELATEIVLYLREHEPDWHDYLVKMIPY